MDSIKLKDGKVIFIGDHKSHMTGLAEVSEKGDKIFVTVTTGEDGKNKEVKVVKGEPIMIMDGDGGENVVVVKKGTHMIEGEGGKVMVWSSASSGEKDNVIYIQKGKADVKDGEKKINVEIREDGSGNKVEKTNYVIARDGMVVTIEGDNEEKVKELAGVIESKMGISEKNNKQVVKEETKKTIRK
jgi:hypothetical protein